RRRLPADEPGPVPAVGQDEPGYRREAARGARRFVGAASTSNPPSSIHHASGENVGSPTYPVPVSGPSPPRGITSRPRKLGAASTSPPWQPAPSTASAAPSPVRSPYAAWVASMPSRRSPPRGPVAAG